MIKLYPVLKASGHVQYAKSD